MTTSAGKILKNRIRCNSCLDTIESKHVHDFVRCTCNKVAVDGGKEYLRRVAPSRVDYEELSEFAKEPRP